MIDWANEINCPIHVLLTKSDKLKRGAAANTLLKLRKELQNKATIQLFSALKRTGEEEARVVLDQMLAKD
jgi:GTP-binding protein